MKSAPRRGLVSTTGALLGTALLFGCGNTVRVESSSGAGGVAGAGSGGGAAGTGSEMSPHPCNAVFADCNGDPGDGCEVALMDDGHHCGSCGRDCQGSACVDGICAPDVLASDQYYASRLSLDGARVYWTSADGGIRAIPLAGGDPQEIAGGQDDPWDIAVDGLGVYWTDSGNDRVMALPFGDDLPKTLADAGNPLLLVVRGDHVYFTDTYDKASSDEHVRRVPVAGGATVNVSATLGAWGVAVDASRAYWTDPASDEVWSAPLAGGLPEPMATSVVDPTDIEVDEEAVYVTAIEATYRIPLDGGPPEALVWGAGRGLAVDGERVFVGTADGRILAVPKHGGAALTLSKGDLPPSDIGVSDSHVYWILRDLSGSLLRTPK